MIFVRSRGFSRDFPFRFIYIHKCKCLKHARDKARVAMTDNGSAVLHSEHPRLHRTMSITTKAIIKLNSSVLHAFIACVKRVRDRAHVATVVCIGSRYLCPRSLVVHCGPLVPRSQGQVLAKIYARSI